MLPVLIRRYTTVIRTTWKQPRIAPFSPNPLRVVDKPLLEACGNPCYNWCRSPQGFFISGTPPPVTNTSPF
ncbi:hypothetical protein RRG08_044647 [Elysia crispata]|uniref:Uncharacterized protein n=1 Tax=Elysia crispata TaxID=231223 RepID=A0AAE1B6R9_9GAST|nr:hypothetical protein RRG08_044647 [Elysia crispata]